VPLKIIALAVAGQFRALLTYFSLPDARHLAAAMGGCGLIALIVWFALGGNGVVPRGVIVSDTVISFLALAALRVFLRLYRERLAPRPSGLPAPARRRRAAIAGAGSVGAALLRDIQGRPGLGLEMVCFFDDDTAKIGSNLHGIPVLGPVRKIALLAGELDLQKLIIAMPAA
jgi:FlaA1/EpsC-like NDP-sugar epimerase